MTATSGHPTEGRQLPALRVSSVAKSFGGTHALTGVGLEVCAGEIHGLVGENGCGKSTLVKILSGIYQADEGELAVGSETLDATDVSPAEMRRCGIRAVHQDTPMFGNMTIADNLFIGRSFPRRLGRIDRAEMRRRAAAVLARFDIPTTPDALALEVDFAVRAMVAIARELQDFEAGIGGVLILDEPTAGLSEPEVETLLAAVRKYATDGHAIILVTHRLDEILDACDRVTVFRDGAFVTTRDAEGLDRHALVGLIVGNELEREYETARPHDDAPAASTPLLAVRGLHTSSVHDISFEVQPGEILGVAGLVGAGTSDVLAAVAGSERLVAGTIEIAGEALGPGIETARERGVAFVPRDRVADGAFSPLTVRENLAVGELRGYWRRGRMDRGREQSDAERLIAEFDIHPPDPSARLSNLSGGNQQKVMMARALRRDPRVLLLDEPTQGVDVGARAQIHRAIRGAVDAGAAAVVSSSDLEELVRISDRVLVLVAGRVAAVVSEYPIDRDTVATLVHSEPQTLLNDEVAA